MLVLGIESSCDDTAVAVYDTNDSILSHSKYSQLSLHNEFGGVVPELASRDHARKIVPLIRHAIQSANLTLNDLDAIAFTTGPGLIGAVLVGASVGRALAYGLDIPAIGVHHMEAHLLAPMLEADKPEFPFIALLVSGGHTLLVHVKGLGEYDILGESLDDAAGEAFDKTAKLLGLDYPGGPALALLAEQGDASVYQFPRPMLKQPGCDFSFSGLKTFALNTWQNSNQSEQDKANIACAFEEAIVDTLAIKCKRALEQTGLKRLVVAGGVSANKKLRQQLQQISDANQYQLFFPRLEYCTDNAAMVAYAGAQHFLQGEHDSLAINVKPRWPLTELNKE